MEYAQFFRFIYLLGAVNAVFFSILIFKKAKRSRADVMLGIWLLVLSAQLFIPFFYLMDESKTLRLAGYESILMAYHAIFLFNYIILITGERCPRKRIFRNFLPAFILTIYFIVVLISLTHKERVQLFQANLAMPLKIWGAFIGILSCLEIYLGLSFIKLRKHKRKVLQLFSYRDNIDLYWLWKLLITFSIIYAIVITLAIVFYFIGTPLYLSDFVFYSLLVVFIFFLGYWGWQQGTIFSYENGFLETAEKESLVIESQANSFNTQKKSEEGKMLESIMSDRKLFLNQSLSLHDLTNETSIPPHQLSKVIHRDFGMNFFEFVNRYRVNYFKEIANLPHYQHYTILAIAYECGFNSKASFNRIFKEYTGTTPGEFRKNA
ncbi:MAG: helix-turn-helix domain-containing protein [Prolixibacteraceae bacterium]